MVKYTAVSIVLLQVRTVKSLKLNGGPTWYSHAGLILYITASVSVVANHIVGMIKFKETITLRAVRLFSAEFFLDAVDYRLVQVYLCFVVHAERD